MKIIQNENRIEVYATMPGWIGGETSIVALSKIQDKWYVGCSMALPSRIDQAEIVIEAYNKAFDMIKTKTPLARDAKRR